MAARTRVPDNAHTGQGRRHDDSWVEISSQPSSSSLSSIGDDFVTAGLQVGIRRKPSMYERSHRRPTSNEDAGPRSESSSHDEYEETSDEDLLTSSTEYLAGYDQASLASIHHRGHGSTDSDNDDENATAVGIGRGATLHSPPGFHPQPNAFSHPPRHPAPESSHRLHSTMSAGPAAASHPHSAFSHRTPHGGRAQHTASPSPMNFMTPSSAAVDNDAALRASLTTLLSCAAGLRKNDATHLATARAAAVPPSQQPMELRLVPESELMAAEPAGAVATSPQQAQRPRNRTGSADKSKRSAAMAAEGGIRSSQRAAKKTRIEESTYAMMSPTFLTWVVSAGLVVLVGFGAGYVIGREVGKQEAMVSMNVSSVTREGAAGCGREVIHGSGGTALKKLRWGASFGKSIVA